MTENKEDSGCSYKSEKTLLSKYKIPLDHLDFDYVKKCTDGKELERIVRILRSGEEGHYPELIETTEKCLAVIKPQSKLLRKEEPMLTKNSMSSEQWNTHSKDLQTWTDDIKKLDTSLQKHKFHKKNLPAVRKSASLIKNQNGNNSVNKSNPKRISSCDYAAWDKYDPDTDLLKQELEEEKQKKQLADKLKKQSNKDRNCTFKIEQKLTKAEALVLANQEKDKGNESYKAGDLEEAEKQYTKSICIKPTVAAYNNRCLIYIKLNKYTAALEDANYVLNEEPENMKALLRKAQILQNMEEFFKAMECIEKAITLEPNDKAAQSLANDIRCKLPKSEKRFRLAISENATDENDAQNSNVKIESSTKTKKIIIPIPSTSQYTGPTVKIVEIPVTPDSKRIRTDDDINRNTMHEFTNLHEIPYKPKAVSKTNLLKCLLEGNTQTMSEIPHNYSFKYNRNEIIETESNRKINDNIVNNNFDNSDEIKNSNVTLNIEDVLTNLEINSDTQINQGIDNISSAFGTNNAGFAPNNSYVFDNHCCGEPYPESDEIRNISSPFEFITLWQAIETDPGLKSCAKLIKRINLSELSTVIGNNLDSHMLSLILRSLELNFLVPDNVLFVVMFLNELCRLPRFDILAMFFGESDKTTAKNIIAFLKQHGQIITNDINDNIIKYL